MCNPTDNNDSSISENTARIGFKQTAIVLLIGLSCAAMGYFFTLYTSESISDNSAVPMIYVARCGFHFKGENCGEKSKNIIFQESDEFLSFTDNWAVGRTARYKMYMSCFGPGDEDFIDGTFSSLTVVVAGPDLKAAYEIANRLMSEFSALLSEQGDSASHCFEK